MNGTEGHGGMPPIEPNGSGAPTAPPSGERTSAPETENKPEAKGISHKAAHELRSDFGEEQSLSDGVHENVKKAAFDASQEERGDAYDKDAKFGDKMTQWLKSEKDTAGEVTRLGMEDWIGLLPENSPISDGFYSLLAGDMKGKTPAEQLRMKTEFLTAQQNNPSFQALLNRVNKDLPEGEKIDTHDPNTIFALSLYEKYLDTADVNGATAETRFADLTQKLAEQLKGATDQETLRNIQAVGPLLNVLGVQSADVMQLILKVDTNQGVELPPGASNGNIYKDEAKPLKFLRDHHTNQAVKNAPMPNAVDRPTPPPSEPPAEPPVTPSEGAEANTDDVEEINPSPELIARFSRLSGRPLDPESDLGQRFFVENPHFIQLGDEDFAKLEYRQPFFVNDPKRGGLVPNLTNKPSLPEIERVGAPRFTEGEELYRNSGEQNPPSSYMGGISAVSAETPEKQAAYNLAAADIVLQVHLHNPALMEEFFTIQNGDTASLKRYVSDELLKRDGTMMNSFMTIYGRTQQEVMQTLLDSEFPGLKPLMSQITEAGRNYDTETRAQLTRQLEAHPDYLASEKRLGEEIVARMARLPITQQMLQANEGSLLPLKLDPSSPYGLSIDARKTATGLYIKLPSLRTAIRRGSLTREQSQMLTLLSDAVNLEEAAQLIKERSSSSSRPGNSGERPEADASLSATLGMGDQGLSGEPRPDAETGEAGDLSREENERIDALAGEIARRDGNYKKVREARRAYFEGINRGRDQRDIEAAVAIAIRSHSLFLDHSSFQRDVDAWRNGRASSEGIENAIYANIFVKDDGWKQFYGPRNTAVQQARAIMNKARDDAVAARKEGSGSSQEGNAGKSNYDIDNNPQVIATQERYAAAVRVLSTSMNRLYKQFNAQVERMAEEDMVKIFQDSGLDERILVQAGENKRLSDATINAILASTLVQRSAGSGDSEYSILANKRRELATFVGRLPTKADQLIALYSNFKPIESSAATNDDGGRAPDPGESGPENAAIGQARKRLEDLVESHTAGEPLTREEIDAIANLDRAINPDMGVPFVAEDSVIDGILKMNTLRVAAAGDQLSGSGQSLPILLLAVGLDNGRDYGSNEGFFFPQKRAGEERRFMRVGDTNGIFGVGDNTGKTLILLSDAYRVPGIEEDEEQPVIKLLREAYGKKADFVFPAELVAEVESRRATENRDKEIRNEILKEIQAAVRVNNERDSDRRGAEEMDSNHELPEEERRRLTSRPVPDADQLDLLSRYALANTQEHNFSMGEDEVAAVSGFLKQPNIEVHYSQNFVDLQQVLVNQQTGGWAGLHINDSGVFEDGNGTLFMVIKNGQELLKDRDGKVVVVLSTNFSVDGTLDPVMTLLGQNFPDIHFAYADSLPYVVPNSSGAAH